MRVLQLAIHAVIALVGLLAPNRSAQFVRHLVRQITLARIQRRWVALSATDLFDSSVGTVPRPPREHDHHPIHAGQLGS